MRSILFPALMVLALAVNATGTFSMIEINPQHGTEQYYWSDSSKHIYGAGELSNITELNGRLYFVAQDTTGNEELWTSDGTQAGTYMVKDINPDGSSMIGNILKVDGKLLFMATDNNNWDFDLFSSDGTEGGTIKVSDISQGWNDGLSPQRAAVFGNKVLFCTSTSLISTDGTVGGTNAILSISAYASPAQGYCELNGKAYFTLGTGPTSELWMTDGTSQNTQVAVNLFNGDSIAYVEKLFAFNGKIYLVAAKQGQGYDLFSFDGTVNGQVNLIELVVGGNADPTNVNVVNNQLLFTASNLTGTNLYCMTTSDLVPQLVPSVSNMDVTSGLSFCNDAVYFFGNNTQQIHSISLGDHSHHVIDLPNYSMPSYLFGDGGFLVGGGGKIFFAAYDTATGKQVLLESNGTSEGTFSIMPSGVNTTHPFNQIISCGAADGFDFKMWGNKVVIPANFNNAGRELWIYDADGLASGIRNVPNKGEVQIFPNPVAQQLNFKIEGAAYCETNVLVTNANGEVMLQRTVFGENASIDVSSLATGNYCITFLSSTAASTVKKFVVVK